MNRFEQAKQIVAGATNYAKMKLHIADEDVEKVFRARMSVCKECEDFDRDNTKCLACGCPLGVRARSMEANCINDHWKAVK